MIKQFEDIEAWQLARELTKRIYAASSEGAFARDFGLRDQIRRAAVSVMSNIAEGHERDGQKEFVQFLSIAKGSCGELRAQLYVALDQLYVAQADFDELSALASRVSRVLHGLAKAVRASSSPGWKYEKN